jgi:hypothetical protein
MIKERGIVRLQHLELKNCQKGEDDMFALLALLTEYMIY